MIDGLTSWWDFVSQRWDEVFEATLQTAQMVALAMAIGTIICIFLGVLCYEMDREGKNIMEELSFSTFAYEDVERLLELSSFREVLEATKSLRDSSSRRNFYHLLARRRLIDKIDDEAFRFTPGHKYFLEFARGVAQGIGREEEE